MAVLLGVETGRKPVEGFALELEEIKPVAGADQSMKLVERDISIDIELFFPEEFVLNRVPFERFYKEAKRG